MRVGDKEYFEMMAQFEKNFPGERYDKEPKESWGKGIVYQDGNVNRLFKAYEMGYAFRAAIANLD